ncbi:MAG: 16S rRNA (uracil(1498)-N(3))-methyltransferase [Chloroflexi bacterium]|nr:16S rRNA (uracil(1498)-N(3))-methyltransferase [Chloroflexota bacterium]
MRRFNVSQKIIRNRIVVSDAKLVHHLKDVLRLQTSDVVTVFDDSGYEYDCIITEMDKSSAVLNVRARKPVESTAVKISVACAIPKGDKMDDIVDSLTQLGVDTVVPLETERVIVRLSEKKKDERLERWRRIARSAAQQSQRGSLPDIEPITSLGSLLTRAEEFDLKLIPTLAGDCEPIKDVIVRSKSRDILVLVGPEGDFTPQEIEQAKEAGFIPISLGHNVLRVGTAAIAIVSYLRLSFAP